MAKVKEGTVSISLSKQVFYNPEMELCRDLSCLAVGTLGNKLELLDAMCATGIRGIRYAKENANIARTTFLDANKLACTLVRKNAKANKLKKFKVVSEDINLFLATPELSFDLIELDPFGSPVPFLYSTINALARKKTSYLSVTATDTAVLCGAHAKACVKNYQSHPVDNEYCHELGTRILIGKIVRTAAELNLGTTVLFTLSRQHFFKLLVRFDRGAAKALNSVSETGHISVCNKCLNREWRKGLPAHFKCPLCKLPYEHAGPLWLGPLWNAELVQGMTKLNHARNYKNKQKLNELLTTILEEAPLPPTYFDLHRVSKRLGITAVRVDDVMHALRSKKLKVSRTHFKSNSIRTDAKIREVKKAIKKVLSRPRRA